MNKAWWWRSAALAVLLLCTIPRLATAAIDPDDLLPVDEAFALRVEAVTRERIELTWTIADGYYLYRHRMDVQRVEEGFKIDRVRWPAGEKHHDEFFGDVETYRDSVSAAVTGAAADGMRSLTLRVKYQGCADAGICYPPQMRTIKVALLQQQKPAMQVSRRSDGRSAASVPRRSPGPTSPRTATRCRCRRNRRSVSKRLPAMARPCCCGSRRRRVTTSIATAPH